MLKEILALKKTVVILNGDLTLRILLPYQVSNCYVEWMNDYEVTKYTEQRFEKTTRSEIELLLAKMLNSSTDLMYGIFLSGEHVGTIKLGNINKWHMTADLSYLIGSKRHWRKGIATTAIAEMTKIGFTKLSLEKISAGVYANNAASIRVLEKNNYFLDCVKKSHFIFENNRIDALSYAREK